MVWNGLNNCKKSESHFEFWWVRGGMNQSFDIECRHLKRGKHKITRAINTIFGSFLGVWWCDYPAHNKELIRNLSKCKYMEEE